MKVNEPFNFHEIKQPWVYKINSKEQADYIYKKLDKIGYKWCLGDDILNPNKISMNKDALFPYYLFGRDYDSPKLGLTWSMDETFNGIEDFKTLYKVNF